MSMIAKVQQQPKILILIFFVVVVSITLLATTSPFAPNKDENEPIFTTPQYDEQYTRGLELEKRFDNVVKLVGNMQKMGQYSTGVCLEEFTVGDARPAHHTPDKMGTVCEPWLVRYAIEFLERYLDITMRGLEWGSGTGTFWQLARMAQMTSVEHYQPWKAQVEAIVAKFPEDIKSKWVSIYIPVNNNDYTEYSAVRNLPNDEKFDFISVDGRNRVECFKRALQLIKPHGGLLMLDNAERDRYAPIFEMVPKHWKTITYTTTVDTTVFWLTRPAQ